jgi:general secretion pathway protein I
MRILKQKMLITHASKRPYGFSLLEALVALVLLTTAGFALFSWINSSFDALNRIETSNARAAAEINALEYLKTVNPMQRPEGEMLLGDVAMHWRARALEPPRANMTDAQTPGIFMVALYEVEVTLESLPALPRYSFTVRQMGYFRTMIDDDRQGGTTRPPPSGRPQPR